jgi:hypothetical protein
MLPPRQFLSLSFAVLLDLLAMGFAPTMAQTPEATPAPSQAANPSASPSATAESPQPLPKEWDDAIRSLARKIKEMMGSSESLTLGFQNIATLSETNAAAIQNALQTELLREHLEWRASGVEGSGKVHVTLSESINAYVLVATARLKSRASGEQTVGILTISKSQGQLSEISKPHINLDKRMIWEQPNRFLDIGVIENRAGVLSFRVILEPTRLVFYESSDSGGNQPRAAISIPQSTRWLRTATGSIDTSANEIWTWDGDPSRRFMASAHCTGDLQSPWKIQCSAWQEDSLLISETWRIPGHQDSASVGLGQRCGPGRLVLSTGTGDWTQPDSIQAYLAS